MTCVKIGHLFISRHSFIKKKDKKKPEENLIYVSLLSSDFWLRQHGPFFYQVLYQAGTGPPTHSLSQSIN